MAAILAEWRDRASGRYTRGVSGLAGAAVASDKDLQPLILRFAEIRPEHAPLVGGKGYSLGIMRAVGLPVPDGFCLTTEAMRAFIRESEGLEARLEEIARQATSGNLSLQESWAFLGDTRKVIVAAPIPSRIR